MNDRDLVHDLQNIAYTISTALEIIRLKGGNAPGLSQPIDVIGRQAQELRKLADEMGNETGDKSS